MSLRHALLPVGAVLVLGVGVYLLVEVRAQPAPPAGEYSRGSRPPPAEAPIEPAAPPNAAPPAAPPAAAPAAAPPAVSARASTDAASSGREVATPAQDTDLPTAGPKLDAMMDEANRAYDRGDFEDAKQLAARLLAAHPTNVRMLRIMVSASCIDGDSALAQLHYAKLPARDQEQMRIRCARYGVAFVDKP